MYVDLTSCCSLETDILAVLVLDQVVCRLDFGLSPYANIFVALNQQVSDLFYENQLDEVP